MAKAKKKDKAGDDGPAAVMFGDDAGLRIGGLRAPTVAIAIAELDDARSIILALSVNEAPEGGGVARGYGKGEMPWYVHSLDAEGARTVAASLLAHAASLDPGPRTAALSGGYL